MPCVAMGKL